MLDVIFLNMRFNLLVNPHSGLLDDNEYMLTFILFSFELNFIIENHLYP